jgi:hypothetical protein
VGYIQRDDTPTAMAWIPASHDNYGFDACISKFSPDFIAISKIIGALFLHIFEYIKEYP